jgi:hypothetical protein
MGSAFWGTSLNFASFSNHWLSLSIVKKIAAFIALPEKTRIFFTR